MTRTKRIGVFDSGFGGLDVLSGIVAELPEYSYVYLGDSARVPYGPRSQKEIYSFTRQAVKYLFKHDCDLVILACNSASSEALHVIQREDIPANSSKRVLGVLIPSAEEAVIRTQKKRVGVIATEATVRSSAFTREVHKLNPGVEVYEQACPFLVPLVERGLDRSIIAKATVVGCLKPLGRYDIDTLILGCTHYGILEPLIREVLGLSIAVVNQKNVVPRKLADYLVRHPDIEASLIQNGARQFLSTKPSLQFDELGSRFFGSAIVAELAKLS
ncbi:MAG: glutamate racemase [Patescibacteria group bacterium]